MRYLKKSTHTFIGVCRKLIIYFKLKCSPLTETSRITQSYVKEDEYSENNVCEKGHTYERYHSSQGRRASTTGQFQAEYWQQAQVDCRAYDDCTFIDRLSGKVTSLKSLFGSLRGCLQSLLEISQRLWKMIFRHNHYR